MPLTLRALFSASILTGRRLAEALTISLPLAARCARGALQTLWTALGALAAAGLTLSTARLTLSVPLLTLVRRPRTSPLPGAAGLPARLATTRWARRPPILPPLIAATSLAGATLEAVVAETGLPRFESWTEPSRARADRFGTTVKSEVALPAKSLEPALAAQLGTFDDPAEDAAQNRSGRNLARVRFAAVLGGSCARGGQEGRNGDCRDPKMLQERLPKSACPIGKQHTEGSSLHVS